MYQVLCDGELLQDLRLPDYSLSEATLDLEVNAAGKLGFSIYPAHPRYHAPITRKSTFEVRDGAEVLFRGRMLSQGLTLFGDKTVTAEGALAYLHDSVIRPFTFPDDVVDDPDYQTAATSGNVAAYLLGWILAQHNAQVTEDRRLLLGTVTVKDANNYVARSSDGYASAWDTVRDKLFESSLGGYLYARYEADGTYVDYVDKFSTTALQDIDIGVNLLERNTEDDGSTTYSVVLPLGAKMEDGSRLTITSLADGDVTSDIVKEGDQLYSRAAVAAYGRICAPTEDTTWDDVTLADNLQSKAATYLANTAVKQTQTVDISAVDLHLSDSQIAAFRPYQNVRVSGESYEVSSISYSLSSPSESTLTLGSTKRTLTGDDAQQKHDTDVAIGSMVTDIKGNAEKIESVSQRVTNQSTSIIQDAQQIIFAALEDYVKTQDYDTFRETVQTSMSVMAGQIEFNFKTTTDQINNVDGEMQRFFNEQSKYIRFINGDIVLGEEGNEISLTIENDRISFKQDNLEVAYFADHKLYIQDAEFIRSIIVGNFAFQPAQNGSLSFRKVR